MDINFNDFYPNFSNLPMEIILQIFRYLNFDDLQSVGLTCRRWLEATNYYEFLSRIELKFSKNTFSDSSESGVLLTKSIRDFSNIYLDEIILSGNYYEIFRKLGESTNSITFRTADITTKQFCSIIKEMKQLKELSIVNCSSLFMDGQFLESPIDQKAISENMSSINSLSLRINQYLSDAILLRITSSIVSLEKLDMCGCHIAYHSGIQRRFYPPNLEDTPSSSILTFKFILKVVEKYSTTLKEIDLSQTLIGGQALSKLVDVKGLELKRITFDFCRQLNFTGLNTLAESQRNLLELNLSNSDGITDSCVELLTENLEKLQVFKMKKCRKLTNQSAIAVSKLKYLKVLDFSYCNGITSDGIKNGIAKTKNSEMKELYLVAIDICESSIIQCAENLKQLRALSIANCINGVTDLAVQAIIKNLRWLKYLNLEGCVKITDTGLTGIDFKSQLAVTINEKAEKNKSPTSSFTSDLSINTIRISLRSKAEEDIIQDAERKKAIVNVYEMNNETKSDGLSIKELKGLEFLNLQGCSKISDVSLKYGLKFLELRNLILSNCQQISVIGLEALVFNCSSIEDLNLSDCNNINDTSIEIITMNLKRLKYLNISGCIQLTDHSLDSIICNCKILKSISVNRCKHICSDFDYLQTNIPSLRYINMDRPTLDNFEMHRLKKRFDY